jgi:hypothetical protein
LAIGMPIALTPSSLAEAALHHSFINDDTEPEPHLAGRWSSSSFDCGSSDSGGSDEGDDGGDD